ncbi:hypothetical protein KW803_01900 [Candidatus Saccharibacteria bacterium]|nr:hypothetical protein [Candidatus Saccharibacteria bacterium]
MLNKKFGRPGFIFMAIIFMMVLVVNQKITQADIITQRSITLSSASPLDVASHTFKFTVPSTTNLGSIVLEYCTISPLSTYPCVAPAGLDANSAVLSSQSGGNTGFSIDNADTTSNKLVIARTASAGVVASNTYTFNNITNPSTPGQTVFVRISTHSSTDGSGTANDDGAVAFAVQSIFNIGAYVPPFLKMCVGISVAPDCTTQTGDFIDLGILTPVAVRSGVSQFSTATNDPSGYVIYALGTTLTSGNNTINSLAGPTPSAPGNSQFGINLRANLAPASGQDPVGVGTGLPTPNYNIPNRYTFNSGDSITSSNIPSNYNRMTVTYIANIVPKQPPGIYATTVTYVATVQF